MKWAEWDDEHGRFLFRCISSSASFLTADHVCDPSCFPHPKLWRLSLWNFLVPEVAENVESTLFSFPNRLQRKLLSCHNEKIDWKRTHTFTTKTKNKQGQPDNRHKTKQAKGHILILLRCTSSSEIISSSRLHANAFLGEHMKSPSLWNSGISTSSSRETFVSFWLNNIIIQNLLLYQVATKRIYNKKI